MSNKLFALVEKIEANKEFLFVVNKGRTSVGVDIYDYETEDLVDGGNFVDCEDAAEYLEKYYVR